jgi:hypothetical protein
MKKESDGVYTYNVNVNNEERLKVYDTVKEEWIGEESVVVEESAAFTIDKHGNLVLSKGSYTIIFDSDDRTIIIKKH